MAGTLTISTLSDGTNSTSSTNCIQGSARAWVNFGYVSSAITVRGSFNVSSVTRNATGDYTVNYTNNVSNANYAVSGSAALLATGSATPRFMAPVSQAGLGVSNVQIKTADDAGSTIDCAYIAVVIQSS
jgi:hypothetical protein